MRGFILLIVTMGSLASAQALPAKSKPPKFGSIYVSVMGEPFRAEGGVDAFERWFKQADLDGDGAISRLELVRDADFFFEQLDVDGDLLINADEIERYERVVAPPALRAIGSDVGNYARVQRQSGPRGASGRKEDISVVVAPNAQSASRIEGDGSRLPIFSGNIPQPVAMADSNLDRRITPVEFREAANRRFARYDRDNDGKLTRKELQASKASR